MKKGKTIQVSERLFYTMYLFVSKLKDGELDESLLNIVDKEIEAKFEAMERRDLYTQSKIADTKEEREKARKKYLDEVGIHQDWRW